MQLDRSLSHFRDTEGETITIRAKVAGVESGWEVVVTSELYNDLKGRIGEVTITNCQTHEVSRIKDFVNVKCMLFGESEYGKLGLEYGNIIVSKKIARRLALAPGDSIELSKSLSYSQKVLWKCGEDKTNTFGSSYTIHHYVATAIFAGTENSPVKGRLGIFLNRMQIQNLNLDQSLRPLCGYSKFEQLKAESPKAISLVKVFFKGKEFEIDIYPHQGGDPYPRSGVVTTDPLFREFGLKIGDPLQICSRFDVSSYEEAENMLAAPVLEKRNFGKGGYLEILRLLSPNEIQEHFFDGRQSYQLDFALQQVLADFVDDLTVHAEDLANDPNLLLKGINFLNYMNHSIADMLEYSDFLKAVGQHEEILIRHQDVLMDLLVAELLRQSEDYYNPPLLDAIFKMGVGLKNTAGENCLHIMFRLKRGTVEDSSSKDGYKSYPHFITWMKEKTLEGKTPLHYICQVAHRNQIIFIGKEILEKFNSMDFTDPHAGTPFHALTENLSDAPGTISTLKILVEYLGIQCFDWLDCVDHLMETPLQKMMKNKTFVHIMLSYFIKTHDAVNHELARQISNRLGDLLGLGQ